MTQNWLSRWKLLLITAMLSSTITLLLLYIVYRKQSNEIKDLTKTVQQVQYVRFDKTNKGQGINAFFSDAVISSQNAVVHVKSKFGTKKGSNENEQSNDFFDQLYGQSIHPLYMPDHRSSGSGVLISEDGYIVTNNHVITEDDYATKADMIEIVTNEHKTYIAKIIGIDSANDIAVLKIDGHHLPFLLYGNSDALQLGQWVLAIGFPLTLESTVTAGVVSANNYPMNNKRNPKSARTLIQTDAAINHGSSGGALVNTNGELVGINSYFLGPYSYTGFSFAIPVKKVKEIVEKILLRQ